MYRCIRNDSSNKAYPERISGRAGESRDSRKGGWEPLYGLLDQEQGKDHTHCQNASGTLTDRKNAERSSLCEKQRCMRKCRLCRKRAKSACEGRCKANGKDVGQERRTLHSGSAGTLRKSGGGERKKKGKNPLKHFASTGPDGR